MKQEIICKKCDPIIKKEFPSESPYPGEHVKFVNGKAKVPFICDHCGNRIQHDEPATAFSIWADHGAQPYTPWEDAYLYDIEK